MVLVTKGANGAELRAHGKVFTHAAFNVSASDTTGAGDTFLGAFLASYALNGSGEEALAFAAASSAIQVTRPGAADAIPSKEEVEAFLKEREL